LTPRPLNGFHHVTAIASDPRTNIDFYVERVGMRLVKRTVNFDDPHAYHLYYGDERGRPGTLMTFFCWPGAPRGRGAAGNITEVGLRGSRDPGPVTDPDGLRLSAARGPVSLDSITVTLRELEPTARMLTELLGFEAQRDGAFRLGEAILRVDVKPEAARTLMSAGVVHHVAWSVSDDEQQQRWRTRIAEAGVAVTPARDRQYFHSIYFNEPGGVLFEIATDPPGFAIDEPPDHLGEDLRLPPWLEPLRQEIAAALPAI
jgi:glyoxalase family protein